MEIDIIAILTLKKEYKDVLMPVLTELVQKSREEPGNRRFEMTEDIEDPLLIILIERWASMEAIEYHCATEHYKAYRAFIEGKVESRVARRLRKLV